MKVITIGRSEENDVVISDPYATRNHLQIIQHDNGSFSLSDFGSTNGTFVNGQKISGEIVLNEMDIVRIGNTTIPWRMYFDEDVQEPTEINVAEPLATEIAQQATISDSPQSETVVTTQGATEVSANATSETVFDNAQKTSDKTSVGITERDGILLSSMSASITLLVTMSLPVAIMMIMGLWEAIGRLVVALLFGVLAIVFSKRADKKVRENNIEKAVKSAKTARGFNVVQLIYGIMSWIALILGVLS